MHGFKLLAIRPLVECAPKFLKNLTKGYIYTIYPTYEYLGRDGRRINETGYTYSEKSRLLNTEVSHISNRKETSPRLFDIQMDSGQIISMEVGAVVGKNGSGKSALLEILYAMSYVIALRKGIIETPAQKIKDKKPIRKRSLRRLQDIEFFLNDFRAEIFYEVEGGFYGIRWDGLDLTHHFLGGENKFSGVSQKGIFDDGLVVEKREKFLQNSLLFYTIAINYSLYGLNTESDNSWLQDLFHKNDSYQTPVVINPFRIEGNIDVNNELHLAQTRLLLNVFKTKSEEFSLVNDKKVNLIAFELNYNKFNTFRNIRLEGVIAQFQNDYDLDNQKFFRKVYTTFYGSESLEGFDLTAVKNHEILIKYLYRKIFKIAWYYEEYRGFLEFPAEGKPIPKIKDFYGHLKKLKKDRSHITLKLLQILNIIRYNFFAEDSEHQWQKEEVDDNSSDSIRQREPIHSFTLSFENLIHRIQRVYVGNEKYQMEEFIPAACVIPRLAVKTEGTSSNFEVMSSGEQHFVQSMQSIFYHLKNIDSVFASGKDKINYQYVNLALDEIELYFHPEFQRNYIYQLRKGIRQMDLKHIKGINVLLSTHSPFILSDIPHTNILKMDGGKVDNFQQEERTLGANVHDLLKNDFFLKKSFMGEQAREIITSLITFLKGTPAEERIDILWDQSTAKGCMELVGEPILRNSLRELYLNKYRNTEEIDREIDRLKKLRQRHDWNQKKDGGRNY